MGQCSSNQTTRTINTVLVIPTISYLYQYPLFYSFINIHSYKKCYSSTSTRNNIYMIFKFRSPSLISKTITAKQSIQNIFLIFQPQISKFIQETKTIQTKTTLLNKIYIKNKVKQKYLLFLKSNPQIQQLHFQSQQSPLDSPIAIKQLLIRKNRKLKRLVDKFQFAVQVYLVAFESVIEQIRDNQQYKIRLQNQMNQVILCQFN